MSISDRIDNWVEGRRKAWGEALGNFFLGAIAKGTTQTLEGLEPGTIALMRESLTKVRNLPNITPEIQHVIDKSLETGDILSVVCGWILTIVGIIPALFGSGRPLGRLWEYDEEAVWHSFRFDPQSVIAAWRRDPAKYAWLLGDLTNTGMSDDRIEVLQRITEFLPSPRDLVEWQAKEVFEPAMIEKYGLADEFETLDLSLFAKVGVTEEQARNFWIAHWEHASWNQVVEMVRRGKLTEKDVWDWFRLVEIPPYWRQKLIDISWEVPTRVDVRRFWDMRTIDEPRLREIYTALGYHGKDLDDYVLWTKIYTDFPDLLARFKHGWITLDQVKEELVGMGMKPERADTMIEEKIEKAAPERTADELKLTLSDIYKGVKQNRITRAEGVELIQYLGSTEWEAEFKLLVNVPPDEEDKAEEERLLSKAEILSGLKTKEITPGDALVRLQALRYSAANSNLLLKIFQATILPPVEPKLKEASKADILLGVKKGVITPEEGYNMLIAQDFTAEAASFILTVHAEESPFSPINFAEFADLTQKYRKASGLEGPPMSDEIKRAAADVIRLTTDRDLIQKSIEQEKRGLLTEGVLPAEATARLTQLQASLRQAEGELSRVKTGYNRLVAEFKHTV